LIKSERRIGFNIVGLLPSLALLSILFGSCRVAVGQVAIQTKVSTNQNSASTTVTSPVFSTSAANELLLAFISADDNGTPNTTVKSVTGAGLTWVLVKRTNNEPGDAEIWRAFAPAALSGVSVTANLSKSVPSSMTVLSFTGVPSTGTNGSGAIGAVASGYAGSGAPAAKLVTTQNGSLVVGVGSDYINGISRTPLAGQSLIYQDLVTSTYKDTFWVQQLNAPVAVSGTTVTLGDSAPTSDLYNLSICEIVPALSNGVASPQLTLSASTLAFGNVNLNTASTQTLTLTASGAAAVTVNSASLTGAGFSMTGATFPATLNPGQTATLQVSFDPTAAGAANGTITISSNSSSGSTNTVSLSGTGVSPQLAVSASTLAFGSVAVNSTASQTLTLTSSGTAPVTVNSATLAGTGFKMSGAAFPVTLNPGQTASLQVNFAPTTAGAASGTITISSNGASGTLKVNLSGTGVSSQLTASASTLAFGNVTLKSTSSQTLTLTSSGTAAVTVNSATLSGAGFTMSGATFPATLNPGQSLSLQVTFSPTVAGSASGSITISSNANSGSTTSVSLSGSGVSPNAVLTLSSASLSFGNDPVNTPVTLPVTLTSTGSSAVTVNAATLTGAGFTFSGATFPVTLNPNIAITVQVQFDPTTTGAASGALTFSSNSTTGSTSTVSLSGTGTAAQHQVSLSWVAPANSPVPVADYNIYRATGSSSSYQLLNSSNSTSFVDSSAQSNTAYTYYVTSVSGSGAESIPSNQVNVTTPQ
jgi:hypothetical protein